MCRKVTDNWKTLKQFSVMLFYYNNYTLAAENWTVSGVITLILVTIHPDLHSAPLIVGRDDEYRANNTINTSNFGWYRCVSTVHRQVLSFMTSLLGNSDRNLSDAAHTWAVSRTACWPPPETFHFKILLNMLQVPAGNVRCIAEKGKGIAVRTNQ